MADTKLDLEPTPEEPKKLNKKVVGVVIAILIVGIGYLWFGGDSQESKPTTRTEESVNKNKITGVVVVRMKNHHALYLFYAECNQQVALHL